METKPQNDPINPMVIMDYWYKVNGIKTCNIIWFEQWWYLNVTVGNPALAPVIARSSAKVISTVKDKPLSFLEGFHLQVLLVFKSSRKYLSNAVFSQTNWDQKIEKQTHAFSYVALLFGKWTASNIHDYQMLVIPEQLISHSNTIMPYLSAVIQ